MLEASRESSNALIRSAFFIKFVRNETRALGLGKGHLELYDPQASVFPTENEPIRTVERN